MTLLTDEPASGLWFAGGVALFALQAHQASRFLRTHDGPPLTWPLTIPVVLIYLLTTGWLLMQPPALPQPAMLRACCLLVLAIPLTLTDLRCQWLPMRYTMLFWLGGLASAALPGGIAAPVPALAASLIAFALTGAVRWLVNVYQNEERIGLGDVYLMAGLCAWLPWRSACYAAAGGLLLCCLCAAITRQPSKPFAPALFGYLCGVCIFFPQQLAGVL
jgi:leader peptidase (prepilin peptidase)/N-methyltransferase